MTDEVITREYHSALLLDNARQRRELDGRQFALTVRESWARVVKNVVQDGQPELVNVHGRVFLGGDELMVTARRSMERALNAGRINDAELKELIEEELFDELDRFGIVLEWRTVGRTYGNYNRVLDLYYKSEAISPASDLSALVSGDGVEG